MASGVTGDELQNSESKSKILAIVRANAGISRLEIASVSGYSRSTVTRIVDSLIHDDKLVMESGNKTTSVGRPRKQLFFRGDQNYIIGIDMGATYLRGVLSNYNTEFIKEVEVVTEVKKGPEHVLMKTAELIKKLQDTNLIDPMKIKGVGLAVPGLINTAKEIVEYSSAFNWHNVRFKEFLSQQTDLPIFYDNVSRLMALGELHFGKGKDYSNFITINVGYGIGSGIILNRELFYGTNGMSGEFGHIPVAGDRKIRCSCGNYNCLTAYSSGDAIANRARLRIADKKETMIMDIAGNNPDKIDAKTVAEACQKGDPIALEIFRESTNYLGLSIAGLINLFNPEVVFIGGGVSQSGSWFWDNLRNTIEENLLQQNSLQCKILPVSNPSKATIYGAIALVLREVFGFRL